MARSVVLMVWVALVVAVGGCASGSGGADGRSVAAGPEGREVVAAVREMAAPLVGEGIVPGMVVGVVLADGSERVVALGEVERGSGRRVDAGTRFEIGSVTKAMTAVLAADSAERGKLSLSDEVRGLSPVGGGPSGVTVEGLLRHTSGLPRLAGDMGPSVAGPQPYAEYGASALWSWFAGAEPLTEPGEVYAYSNVGSALAGEAVVEAAGGSYEDLLRERLFGPLGMGETVAGMVGAEGVDDRLARPHGVSLAAVEAWRFDAYAPAGAVRSTAGDMLRFVGASMDWEGVGGTLGAALGRVWRVEPVPAKGGMEVLLGWHFDPDGLGDGVASPGVVWHNGQTAGSKAYAGFSAGHGVGVVVLANAPSDAVERLGVLVLRYLATGEAGDVGLRESVELPAGALERYAGRYLLRGVGALVVTVDGGRLFAKLNMQPRLPLWAESETRFFYRAVDAELAFKVSEETGEVIGVTLFQGGRAMKGVKRGP